MGCFFALRNTSYHLCNTKILAMLNSKNKTGEKQNVKEDLELFIERKKIQNNALQKIFEKINSPESDKGKVTFPQNKTN
jgi:ferritin-like metal-binding protein YciE